MAVVINDVADRLGRPRPGVDTPTARQWQIWINQAAGAIDRYQTLHGLSAPDVNDVDFVVLESVAAMVLHPDNAKQVEVDVDDSRISRTYFAGGTGHLDLEPWWNYLWPDEPQSEAAFSIRPTFEPDDRCL